MSNQEIQTFSQLWAKFQTKLKGRIIKESKRQPLEHGLFDQILRDTKSCWESSFDASGRWLKALCEKDKAKGHRIKEILFEDMHFEKEEARKSPLRLVTHLLPLLGASIGFLIAKILGAKLWILLVSALTPALLMLLVSYVIAINIRSAAKKNLIDDYLSQLDKYSNSIISILNS